MKSKSSAKSHTIDGSRMIFGNDICREMDRARARDRKIVYATFWIGIAVISYGLITMRPVALIAGALILSAAAVSATSF